MPSSATPADLERIRVRFATFRAHSVEERERLVRTLSAAEAAEHVLLETCHRVELVSIGDGGVEDGASELTGREAIRRVFEVVAGFDSAVVAEEQLLGQVRGAYEAALASGSTGPILNELFRRTLRFGRAVRSHARPGADRSLADRGAAWLSGRLDTSSASVAVVGTGEVGRQVAVRLAEVGHRITVISRSAERGGSMLERLPGESHCLRVGPLTAEMLADVEAMAIAVRARTPIFSAALIESSPPWVLDLSAPSAVDATAAERLGGRLMALDALGALAGGSPVLAPAVERRLRADIDREVEAFVAWLDARRGADALALLHGEAAEIRRRHLARLRGRASLDARQLSAVEAAASAMVAELLHGPSLELRRGGADADTIRRLFGIER